VYLSNGEVRKQLTVPFLRYLIAKLGENAFALMGVWKNGRQSVEFLFFTSDLDKMKEKKTISRKDRNIRNNLVQFADNLPFSYLKAPRKQKRLDEK